MAFVAWGLRMSLSSMAFLPSCSVHAAPFGVLVQHRHAVDDPAEDEDPERDDRDRDDDLAERGDVPVGHVPVEGDERDVEAVQDDAADGHAAGPSRERRALGPHREGEEEGWQEDEAEHLERVPRPPARQEEVPPTAPREALEADEEVGEEDDGA